MQKTKSNINKKVFFTLEYILLTVIFSVFAVFFGKFILNFVSNSNTGEINTLLFNFLEVHNYGAAFSFLSGFPFVIKAASLTAVLILPVIILSTLNKQNNFSVFSFSLLTAGILINTLERIINGYVTDYIQFDFFKEFPVFNAADIMIVCGAFLLIIIILMKSRNKNE